MDEMEEFLRQAAARKRRQTPPEIQYVEPEVIEAEIVDDESGYDSELSSIPSRHIDTSDLDERTSRLGKRTSMADDRMEAHLHEKFDHRISSLAGDSTSVATEYEDATPYIKKTSTTPTLAAQIVQMFREPASIRNAILLREIIERPEDRW